MKSAKKVVAMVMIIACGPSGILAGKGETTLVTPPWYHCLGMHKVTQTHLDIYSRFSERFDDPGGLFCTKLSVKDDSTTDYDDDELTVFGINSGAGHILYNVGLFSLRISDGTPEGGRRLKNPSDITGDRDGNIFVADTGNDRIMRYRYIDDELRLVETLQKHSGVGIKEPGGVSLSSGRLYVADTGRDRIISFRLLERMLEGETVFSGEEGLVKPSALSSVSRGEPWYYYDDFFVAVIDSFGKRLWKIPTEGEKLLFRYSSLVGKGRFDYLDIDYYGNIYVTDKISGRIHKFDRNLRYIAAIGYGEGGIDLDQPRGIAVYKRFGQVFIAERAGARYFWIGTDLIRLDSKGIDYNPENGDFSARISFLLTEHSLLSIFLRDCSSGKEFTILSDFLFPAGHHDKIIKGTLDGRAGIKGKTARLVVKASPTYSSADICDLEYSTKPVKVITP